MSLLRTIGFIIGHPLSQGRQLQNLSRFLRWQIGSRLVPGPVAFDFVNGVKLLAGPGMTGATGNIYVGLHEFEDMAFTLHFLRPGDLFVDVGANIGAYTVLASAAAGARSVAFEPGAAAFHWLLLNIRLNGISELVDARQCAVGDKEGTALLTTGRDTVNCVVPQDMDRRGSAKVAMSTMDAALQGKSPAMLKIDVEGFETAVIAGAADVLSKPDLRCVLLELTGHGARYGFEEDRLRATIERHGFRSYGYLPKQRALVKADAHPTGNTLFVRDAEFVSERLKAAQSFMVLGQII